MPSVPRGPEQKPYTENARKVFVTLLLAAMASSSTLSLPCLAFLLLPKVPDPREGPWPQYYPQRPPGGALSLSVPASLV